MSRKSSDVEDGSVSMEQAIQEFLIESYENLDQLDRDLVGLEKEPANKNLLASVFRTIHTIKGTCGFLAYAKLETITHVGESLLGRLREGQLTLNGEITSALLAMVDAVRQILSCIEKDGNEGGVDYSGLINTLTRLQQPADGSSQLEEAVNLRAEAPVTQSKENVRTQNSEPITRHTTLVTPKAVPNLGDLLIHKAQATAEDVTDRKQREGDSRQLCQVLVEHEAVKPKNYQFCTFYVDGLFLGVEVLKVQEVIRSQEMTRIPLAPPAISGLINLRGQIVTALDLRQRLALRQRPPGQLPMNVVVRTDEGLVSMLVDEIGDVLEVSDKSFECLPETVDGIARDLVRGVHKLKDRLLLILDTETTIAVDSQVRSA